MIFVMHQLIGVSLILLALTYFISKRSHWLVGLLWGYTVLFAWYSLRSTDFNPLFNVYQLRFQMLAGRAIVPLIAIPLFIALAKREWIFCIWQFFKFAAVVEATLILIFGYGMFNAGSVGTSYIALMILPLMYDVFSHKIRIYKVLLWVILPLASLKESTCWVILAASIMAAFSVSRLRKFALLGLIPIAIGVATEGHKFAFSNGRLQRWEQFMTFWWDHLPHWIGTGPGTFWRMGGLVQNAYAPERMTVWTWMHNEYLQVLFETGFIGLALFLSVIIICLYKSRRTPVLFAVNIGFCVSFLTQMHLRFFITQLLACVLIRLSLNEKEAQEVFR